MNKQLSQAYLRGSKKTRARLVFEHGQENVYRAVDGEITARAEGRPASRHNTSHNEIRDYGDNLREEMRTA
jgi:hypothetical protein